MVRCMLYKNKTVNTMFKFMNEDNQLAIMSYLNEVLNRDYINYTNAEQILMTPIFQNNRQSELLSIYSGWNYKHINNAIRGNWNYEENGNMDRLEEFLDIAEQIKDFINNHPTSIGNSLLYRGVNISYFKDYGISKVEELKELEGDYLLDKGFVSTSLLEKSSFYQKKNDLGINYNVEIIYKVPEEFDDLAYIADSSYNKEQYECLINTMNIAKVESVNIDGDNAVINTLLIPKKIYDPYYAKDSSAKSV